MPPAAAAHPDAVNALLVVPVVSAAVAVAVAIAVVAAAVPSKAADEARPSLSRLK